MLHFRKYIHLIQRNLKQSRNAFNNWIDETTFKLNGCVLKENNIKSKFYLPNFKLDSIQGEIRRTRNYFELENLVFTCTKWNDGAVSKSIKSNVILDIGANIGNHTLFFLNECNALHVHAFEPVVSTFNILKKNINLNGLSDKVSLHNYAIGSAEGSATITHYDERNIGGTTLEETRDGSIRIIPIDTLNISEKIGLIKIDVEGFEVNVIKGMMTTIKRDMPYIMIEIRHANLSDILQLLYPLGYNHTEIHPQISWWDYNDYLFFPKEQKNS